MCFLASYTNLKLLTVIAKFRLLLVRQQLPESHHQWEAGRWPGGMTDITDVLFIYNFNKKQKKHLPCVLIEHKVIPHHTAFLLPLPELCSDISSLACAVQSDFFSNALCARELPPLAYTAPAPAQANSLGLWTAIKLRGFYPTHSPTRLSFCFARLSLFLGRNITSLWIDSLGLFCPARLSPWAQMCLSAEQILPIPGKYWATSNVELLQSSDTTRGAYQDVTANWMLVLQHVF